MSSEPEWRTAIRECRLCIFQTQPLIFTDNENTAKPLFHEEGNLKSAVLFIVEAPNWADTFDSDKGKMTVGIRADATDRFFDDRLKNNLQLSPNKILCTNSVLCLPARVGNKYPVRSLQRQLCSPHLRTMIENVNPKIVVPLGGEALAALNLIERHRLTLSKAVSHPHDWFGRMLFPMYHPGQLARVTRPADKQVEDYKALKALLDRILNNRLSTKEGKCYG